MFFATIADAPATVPDPEAPSPLAGAGAPDPDPTPTPSAVTSLPPPTEKRWKAVGDEVAGRRENLAAPAPTTGGGRLSPLSTTAGQLALILVVVGLVGGVMAAWTLRPSRR